MRRYFRPLLIGRVVVVCIFEDLDSGRMDLGGLKGGEVCLEKTDCVLMDGENVQE